MHPRASGTTRSAEHKSAHMFRSPRKIGILTEVSLMLLRASKLNVNEVTGLDGAGGRNSQGWQAHDASITPGDETACNRENLLGVKGNIERLRDGGSAVQTH